MSDATKKAMDDAIEVHIADEVDGRILVGYVMCIKAIDLNDPERKTMYKRIQYEEQDFATTLGLFHTGILGLEEYWRSTDE